MRARGAAAMLAYKAWCESRGRFLVGAALVAGMTAAVVLLQEPWRAQLAAQGGAAPSFDRFVYVCVYGGVVRLVFLVVAALLGLGGLHRERAHGSLGFTLALPVARGAHTGARAAVGLLQVVALAWAPAVLVPVGAALAGESYAWGEAATFAALWTAAGALVLAASLLVSVLVRSDHAALVIALVGLRVVPMVLARVPALRDLPIHIDTLMNGRGQPYFDARTARLVGEVPWAVLAGMAAVAALLLALAARLAARGGERS